MNPGITIAEAIADSIRQTAASYHPGVEDPPVCVLWTDPDKGWQPLIPQMCGLVPELLILGEYKPEERQGPVVWLKCALARKFDDLKLPKDRAPVLYLPGVARHQLKNADQCPWELQPFAELLYRGAAWTHRNGRDWTVEGFFMAEDGLGLNLAQDESTRLSLRSALTALAQTPVSQLAGKPLKAMDFDAVVVGDTPRDLLTWVGKGGELKEEWGSERWHAFRSRCRDDFGFDPEKEAPLYAAENLGQKTGKKWSQLWDRFCEAPGIYAGVRDRLAQAQPTDVLALEPETWPGENQKREVVLRNSLMGLTDQAPHQARQTIVELEKEHGPRRDWVWARIGEAPLANALANLNKLADATGSIPSFGDLDSFASWYREAGWRSDSAALCALQAIENPSDEPAVHQAIRSVYQPWLEEVCTKFQQLVDKTPPLAAPVVDVTGEQCILFVDGLRLDVANRLADLLEQRSCIVQRGSRFAALPSVTATAKPAVSPLANQLTAGSVPSDFRPNDPDGAPLNHYRFQKLLKESGFMVLDEKGDLVPTGTNPKGWCEVGRIDNRGHKLGAELANFIPNELERICSLVRALFFAGWRSVRIVTDHGWLLMPGGLRKYELPGFLVESRWTRCASIKGESKPKAPVVPWHWNSAEHVAVAPGASSFKAGVEYTHGGVSPQECILPDFIITSEESAGGDNPPQISEVRWKRLRCNINVENVAAGLKVDIRKDGSDPSSSIFTAAKPVESDGQVSLLVTDENLEGGLVTVVLLSEKNELIAKLQTTVGG